ncbi:MAG TPA: hypothetical protein VGQ59_09995 [Cyclobacteriaceae bacterium]|nr:hypothetical protein [Cyclobacteriaceae bacterium]
MKNVTTIKSLSAAMVAGILILSSCSKKDEALNSGDTQNVNSESVSDSYTSETADMSTVVVSSVSATRYGTTGRVSGAITGLEAIDSRLTGAEITLTPGQGSTKDNPNGIIIINFGTTGVTTNGVLRKGRILISYSGRKNAGQSVRTLSYDGYSRNGVAFSNTMYFSITNRGTLGTLDSTHFTHRLSGGLLTFPDGSTIVRESDYNITLEFDATTHFLKTVTLFADAGTNSALHSATGTTRALKEYQMDITEPLVYKVECLATKNYFAVSGEKTIKVDNKVTYTIDYGDGTCDNTVTISVGGKSATVTVNGDGN